MASTDLQIEINQPFDFQNLLEAHGWVDLLPNQYLKEAHAFSRIEELPSGKLIRLEISACGQKIVVRIAHAARLSTADLQEVERRSRHMLRLDEDFTEFYGLCRKHGKPWSQMASGKGRMLRSPDLFEDMVKVILTTNVQWGGTRRMAAELVQAYGRSYPAEPDLKAFPIPQAIAGDSLEALQNKTRLGYRAPFIHQLALDFCEQPARFTALWDAGRSTADIRKDLLSVKGIGSYAAASVLMLLGRYDEIPVDSVFTQMMQAKYFKDDDFNIPKALAIYEDWGNWKYLAYWFDLLNFYQ